MAITILLLTLIGNIVLSSVLVARQYYIRYGFLTLSTIFSVIISIVLEAVHQQMSARSYAELFSIVWAICLTLNVAIIFEAYKWRARFIYLPIEIQLGIELLSFLAKRTDFHYSYHVFYWSQVILRLTNIAITAWLLYCFGRRNSDDRLPY